MIILGLDPGLRFTGWGVIKAEGNRLTYHDAGRITVPVNTTLGERLAFLSNELEKVIALHAPHEVAVEETFVNKNPSATLKLGMARGVVMAMQARMNLPVFEYSANQVKKSVVGNGHATKEQIQTMVKILLPKASFVSADDADALALAITHAHHAQYRKQVENK